MAVPFATASDLATRLGVEVWTGTDFAKVTQHLEDASNDLRGEIGWQVYPPVAVTVAVYPEFDGRIRLPGGPAAVTSVVDADGVTLAVDDYELHDGVLRLHRWGRMAVTYTVGYEAPPADLVKWTCVIAAQTLAAADDDRLGGGTPSSEALADYRISYSERQQMGELPVPERVLDRLKATYGTSAYVTS